MKKRAIACLLVMVLLITTLCAGCSAPTEDLSQAKKDYPLTVNGVTIENAPSKVVVLSPSLADIILTLGSSFELKLAGRGAECAQEELSSLPECGTPAQPDTVAIAALKADLVLTDTELPEESVSQLKKDGIVVLTLPAATNRTTLQDLYEKVGAVLSGAKAGYFRAQSQVNKILMALDDITRAIPEAERSVRAAFVLDETGRMASVDTLGGMLLECAGAINIAADSGGEPMTMAELTLADPQVFFCGEGLKEQLLADEKYQSLELTVVELPLRYMEWQGNTVVEATLAMAKVLHPNYITDEK